MTESGPIHSAQPAAEAAQTRWLSDSEQDAWRCFAAVMLRLPSALDTDMQANAGITHFDYMVLSSLSEQKNRSMRMSELAALTTASLSRLSHVVSRLERRGWILRSPSPEDGRYTNATLTEAGFAKVVASAPGHINAVRAMVIDVLSADQLEDLGASASVILRQLTSDAHPSLSGRPPADPAHR